MPASRISETACAASTSAAPARPTFAEVPYWWRKCRIGAQGTEGFAEVQTGSGWRAVTRDGVQSGPGGMDYDLDMPPYVQEMADWLDDDAKPHPLRFARAYHGMEIVSGLYRSAIEGGQIALPLTSGPDEIEALKAKIQSRQSPDDPRRERERIQRVARSCCRTTNSQECSVLSASRS